MKRTVTTTEREISLKDLKNTDHVGFIADTKKWQVVYASSKFNSITSKYGCEACTWQMDYGSDTLKDAVENAFNFCHVTALYVFDTRKELYQWLASDEN